MAVLAQQRPVYQPAMRIVSAITNANPASITTTFNHQYNTGLIVRLDIPLGYGMSQANQLSGSIIVTSSTTFDIAIDTTYFDPLVMPSSYPENAQYVQCVPFGEDNIYLAYATVNVLPYAG